MTPEEITTSFATTVSSFQPILGQPTDDYLTVLWEVLYPLLLEIPYNKLGSHNLIGIIKPMILYTNASFPVNNRNP